MALLAHSRLVISGTIQASQTWSTGIGLAGSEVTPPDSVALGTALTGFVTAINTWWTNSVGPLNDVDVKATMATLTSYPAGSTKAFAVAQRALTLVGANTAANYLPAFTCLVVSTHSNTPGRSGRGRMYLPMTNAALINTHQQSDIRIGQPATATAALLTAMKAQSPLFFTPAVCGIKGNFPITSVSVDSSPDTQRRREDKLAATAKSTAAVT